MAQINFDFIHRLWVEEYCFIMLTFPIPCNTSHFSFIVALIVCELNIDGIFSSETWGALYCTLRSCCMPLYLVTCCTGMFDIQTHTFLDLSLSRIFEIVSYNLDVGRLLPKQSSIWGLNPTCTQVG
jgi:hypothetical protein